MIDVRLGTCWLSPIRSVPKRYSSWSLPLLEWCWLSIGLPRHKRGSLTCSVTMTVCCLTVSFPVRLRGSSEMCSASFTGTQHMRDTSSKSQVETLSTQTLPAILHHVQVARTTSTVLDTIGRTCKWQERQAQCSQQHYFATASEETGTPNNGQHTFLGREEMR